MNLLKKLALAASIAAFSAGAMAQVVLYSGQHKSGTQAVAQAFTQATGIEVDVRSGSSAQLAGQLAEEGTKTPADVYWSEEVLPMLTLSEKGLLAKLPPAVIAATSGPGFETVPKAADHDWVATSGRARVVAYNPTLISKDQLAQSVLDYATPKWAGKVGYVPTSGAFLDQVIAITKLDGEAKALAWLEGLKKYQKPFAKNTVALLAVERGDVPVALINNYYWYAMVRERGGVDKVVSRLDYIGHKDPGALMAYAAIAVTRNAPHAADAQKFVQFVVSQQGEQTFVDKRAEYSLRADVTSAFKLEPMAEVDPPVLTPPTYQDRQNANHLLEKAGLK